MHAWHQRSNGDRATYFPVLDDRVLLALYPASFAAVATHTDPAVTTVNRAFVNPTPPPPMTTALDESLYLDVPDSPQMLRTRAGTVKVRCMHRGRGAPTRTVRSAAAETPDFFIQSPGTLRFE